MQIDELNKKLVELKNSADAQTQAYESSRDKLYQNMVDPTFPKWPAA
jgi:hypothetical protein